MSRPDDSDDEINDTLCSACEEAKQTLDHQLTWLHQHDQKAMQILRADMILIGLILTAFSLSFRTDSVELNRFVNLFTIFGGAALLMSAIGASVTYISSSFEAGMSHNDLQKVLEEEYNHETLYENLTDGYSEWIEYNKYVLGYNSILITITIIMVVNSLALLSIGALVGILEASFTNVSIIAFFITLLFLVIISIVVYKSEDFVLWYFRTRDGD